MSTRVILTGAIVGAVAFGGGTIAYAATEGAATATCEPSPAVTYGQGDATFTQSCSVPVPPAQTVTSTTTEPGPTVTQTVTQTVTESPSPSPSSSSSTSSTSPSPTSTTPSPTSTSPQPAPSSSIVVGARAKDTTNAVMQSTIGPVKAERWFSGGSAATLPATFTRNYNGDSIAPEVDVWASFNTATDANLRSYVKSADPGTKMVLHHEPEGDFPSGADYVSWFDKERAVIKAADPNMPVVHAAASYEYRDNGGIAVDCSYVPKDADIYTIDTYQRHVADITPLSTGGQQNRWRNWLSCIPAGKPIGITEYGRGLVTEDTAAARVNVMKADDAYLSAGTIDGHPVVVWMYWWTSGGAGDWRFTDAASVNAWSAIAAKHNN